MFKTLKSLNVGLLLGLLSPMGLFPPVELKPQTVSLQPSRKGMAAVARTVVVATVALAALSYFFCDRRHVQHGKGKKKEKKKKRGGERGLVDAIGNTPLIRINSLSDATGCEV